jgi:aspartyl-tRNA(Asn)/glutamyl-tRNA(Gln) amidotransferase subunit B
MTQWTTIVGLEAHVELSTKSKMFCSCSAQYFGEKPNTHTCPVCLGLPGALPVPNKKAIDWTILLGLALNCRINLESKFDRKNYFYPDLPKGYQISQYDEPLCQNGYLSFEVEGVEKTVRIRRVHLEEDTGKLLHQKVDGRNVTLVDFNRSGVPLVEIVTEPDIRNSNEAVAFLKKLHQIVKALAISDADMEKGSMRLEPNISVGKFEPTNKELLISEKDLPKYKVEVKNINSFRFVKRSIDFEVARHIKILEKGEAPKQETRGWNEGKKETVSQRSKEEAADYRYFPEPDIPPMKFTEEKIDEIRKMIPKLPTELVEDLVRTASIKKEYAELLVKDSTLLDYFNKTRSKIIQVKLNETIHANDIASLIINKKVDIDKVTPEELVEQIKSKQKSTITDESELTKWVEQALAEFPQVAADYKSGKTQAIGVLIGKVMQFSKGKADASIIGALLRKKL